MSILIKGAKMPKSCALCFYINNCMAVAELTTTEQARQYIHERNPKCPLVEIPPHGRLIDISKMKIKTNGCKVATVTPELLEEWLDAQPTVIESEEE